MTFPPCTHQSHTICLSLELLHLYTTHSRGEMEVTDIPTLKLLCYPKDPMWNWVKIRQTVLEIFNYKYKRVFHRHHQSWWR